MEVKKKLGVKKVGVKKLGIMKITSKGFICDDRQTDKQTNKQTNKQTDKIVESGPPTKNERGRVVKWSKEPN